MKRHTEGWLGTWVFALWLGAVAASGCDGDSLSSVLQDAAGHTGADVGIPDVTADDTTPDTDLFAPTDVKLPDADPLRDTVAGTDVVPDVVPDVAPDVAPDVPDPHTDVVDGETSAPWGEGCGEGDDRKVVLAIPGAAAIVNGQQEHNPDVVALSPGQLLAVGALYSYSYDWWTGSRDWRQFCTGTLVHDRWVLTAAHCLVDADLDDEPMQFRLGPDADFPLATLVLEAVFVHPQYDHYGGNTAANDVGLARLATAATASAPDVIPILPNLVALPEEFLHEVVQTVGYGATQGNGGGDSGQRFWAVEEVTNVTSYDFTVYGGGVSSVCFGDSGGPTLWTFPDGHIRVAGTVSWGDPSCVDYDHFARTDSVTEWLETYVEFEDPGVEPDACGDETALGRCDGQVAVWCEEGAVRRTDCHALGWLCGDAGAGAMRCISGECGDLTFEGECREGEIAVWCQGGTVKQRRCLPCDQTCNHSTSDGYGYYCR